MSATIITIREKDLSPVAVKTLNAIVSTNPNGAMHAIFADKDTSATQILNNALIEISRSLQPS